MGRARGAFAIYDVFYEPTPEALRRLCPSLGEGPAATADFDVDLMGSKPAEVLGRPFLLSARPCRSPVLQVGLEMIPLEANFAFRTPGDFLSLGPAGSFGSMGQDRSLTVIRHLNTFAYWNKYFFQLFKPLQTRLFILRQQLARRRSATP